MEGLTMTCPRFRPRWPSIAVATMHTWHPHQIKTLGVPVDKNTPFSCLARCIQTTFLAKSHARARRGAGRESLQATTSLRGGELTRSSTHRPRLWTRVQSKWYCQGAPGFAAAAPDPRKAWELRRAARSAAWSHCGGDGRSTGTPACSVGGRSRDLHGPCDMTTTAANLRRLQDAISNLLRFEWQARLRHRRPSPSRIGGRQYGDSKIPTFSRIASAFLRTPSRRTMAYQTR